MIDASDRHSYALLVLALFAIFALAVTVMSGSKPAAFAVAAAGAVALLIFLLGDLPRAGQIGTLDDPRQSFIDAEAVPQAGFWLELLGALGLAVSGAALATLTPEQLSLGERWAARRRERSPRRTPTRKPEPKRGESRRTPRSRRRPPSAGGARRPRTAPSGSRTGSRRYGGPPQGGAARTERGPSRRTAAIRGSERSVSAHFVSPHVEHNAPCPP